MNSPFAFTGEPLDGNGLQYHRARYYDPVMGVWASLDPLETANRYMYVAGNPTNLIDPTGLQNEGTLVDAFGKFAQQLAQDPGIQQVGAFASATLTAIGAAVSAEALAVGSLVALPTIGLTYSLLNPIAPHWLTEWIEAAPVAPDAVYKPYGSSQTDVFPTGATPYDYMQSPVAPTTANPAIPMPNGMNPQDLAKICNEGFCAGGLLMLLSLLTSTTPLARIDDIPNDNAQTYHIALGLTDVRGKSFMLGNFRSNLLTTYGIWSYLATEWNDFGITVTSYPASFFEVIYNPKVVLIHFNLEGLLSNQDEFSGIESFNDYIDKFGKGGEYLRPPFNQQNANFIFSATAWELFWIRLDKTLCWQKTIFYEEGSVNPVPSMTAKSKICGL